MNKTLRRLCAFAAAVMLALYCAVAAAAAGKTGSLTVLLSDGDGAAVPDTSPPTPCSPSGTAPKTPSRWQSWPAPGS